MTAENASQQGKNCNQEDKVWEVSQSNPAFEFATSPSLSLSLPIAILDSESFQSLETLRNDQSMIAEFH